MAYASLFTCCPKYIHPRILLSANIIVNQRIISSIDIFPRYSSSTVTAASSKILTNNQREPSVPPPPRDPLDLTFSDTKQAFKSKTTLELLRGWFVLKLTTYDYLVYNHAKVCLRFTFNVYISYHNLIAKTVIMCSGEIAFLICVFIFLVD